MKLPAFTIQPSDIPTTVIAASIGWLLAWWWMGEAVDAKDTLKGMRL